MLDRDALYAAREVGLPVDAVDLVAADLLDHGQLLRRQVAVPAELLQHPHGEFGVAVLDLGTDGIGPFREQVVDDAVFLALHAVAGAEAHAAVGNGLGDVVEVGRTRMVELGRAP